MESLAAALSPARRRVSIASQDASLSSITRSSIGSASMGNEDAKPGFGVGTGNCPASPASGAFTLDGSVAVLSHDVRNLLSALNLYCDLLSEPAVLSPGYQHYAEELRLVAQSGSSLLGRLARMAAISQIQPIAPTEEVGDGSNIAEGSQIQCLQ
jgi:hypothetical protein